MLAAQVQQRFMLMRRRLGIGLALGALLLASGCNPEDENASRSEPDSARASSATPSATSSPPATSSGSAGILDASWGAPTANTDGSPLTDLVLYRLYYDTTSTPCPASAFFQVASPTPRPQNNETVTFTMTGLLAGARYFAAVTAVDSAGLESACSPATSAIARSAGGISGLASAWASGGNAFANGQPDGAIQEPVLTLTGLTADWARPGTTATFTATAAGGTEPYQFKWWLWDGATWTLLGDWATVNTIDWTPSTPNPNSAVGVWVRSAGNTADQPGASGSIPFAID